MDRLFLVRHGIAVPAGTADIADDDRPLTAKGERRAVEVAQGLERLGIVPGVMLTSPLPRAARTATLFAEVLGLSDAVETCDELRAGRSARSILAWLQGLDRPSPMLFGHNPAFSELVALLLRCESGALPFEMKKAAVAAFEVVEGSFRLDWYAPPALLRRLGD